MSSTSIHTDQFPDIRHVRVKDWEDVRDTIIKMLTVDPDAFAETLTEVQSRSTSDWRARVQRWTEGLEAAAFLAHDASGPCGFVSGRRKDDYHKLPPDSVLAGQLWVDPRCRDKGLGQALMEAVTEWAVAVKAVRIYLGVLLPDPKKVVQFYKHLGYRDTGLLEPVSATDKRQSVVMEKKLSG